VFIGGGDATQGQRGRFWQWNMRGDGSEAGRGRMGDAPMMGRGFWLAAAAVGCVFAISSASIAAPAETVVLSPHRAVYDITLDRAAGGSGIADMSGRMVYELTGNVCTGYSQSMRFVTQVVNQEGAASITDLRTTSWEDAASRAFRFNTTQFRDRKLTETTVGDASRAEASGRLKVALSQPSRKQIDLSQQAMFPVQHSRELVVRARRGERLFTADLYDGSEKGDKVYTTISFIGKARAPGDLSGLEDVASAKPLDALVAWPMSISYYEPETQRQDAVPTYELAFLYYSNGVSRRLKIDYGSFAVRGVLKEISFLDPGKCDVKVKKK
jgi:hypothetical protein